MTIKVKTSILSEVFLSLLIEDVARYIEDLLSLPIISKKYICYMDSSFLFYLFIVIVGIVIYFMNI